MNITKLSQLIAAFSLMLLFVFLCNFAVSNLSSVQAGSLASSFQDEDDETHKRHEGEHEDEEDSEHEDDDDDEHGHHEDDDEHEDHDNDEFMDAEEVEMQMMKLEFHAREMEIERMAVESEVMEFEMMHQTFEVTKDQRKMSFFAVMKIDDLMDEEQAIEVLNGCLNESNVIETKRAIRMKLIELNGEMGNEEAVGVHLRALILGSKQ